MRRVYKKCSDKGMAFFFIGFFAVSLIWLFSLVYVQSLDEFTGRTTDTVGSVSVCVNKPPSLNQSCGNAVVGTVYTCDFDAVTESDQNVTFYSNSTFFNINHVTGIIQFTPASSELGTHRFNITAVDNSTCSKYNTHSTEFVLNISISAPIPSAPSVEEAQSSVSGGGAGGAAPVVKTPSTGFSVDIQDINLRFVAGSSYTKTITITNDQESRLSFKIMQTGFTDLLEISPAIFNLEKGESVIINLEVSSSSEDYLGVHTGLLVIEGQSSTGRLETIKLPMIVSVEAKAQQIFDIHVDISPEFTVRMPGQDIIAQITVFDKQKTDKRNVDVAYFIKDMSDTVIVEKTKTLDFTDQISFASSLGLPEDLLDGIYVFAAQVLYEGTFSSASQSFNVISPPEARLEEAKTARDTVFPYFMAILVFLILITLISISIGITHFKTLKHLKAKADKKQEEILKIDNLERTENSDLNKTKQGIYEPFLNVEEKKIELYLYDLENYIDQMIKRGFHPEHITQHLKKHGWEDQHIDKAMRRVSDKRRKGRN